MATTALLANADALASWFPGVAADDPVLVQALTEASARFRGAVRHYVSRETSRTVVLDGQGRATLRLPSINVDPASVVVEIAGAATDVQASASGIVARTRGVFPRGLGNVKVTYSAGFADDAIPEDIQAAVLDMAKVIYTARRGVQSMTAGPFQVTFSGNDSTGVSQQWADAVEAYRIRRADRA